MPSDFESAINKVDSIFGAYPIRRLSNPEISSVTTSDISDGWKIETDLIYLNKALSIFMLVKSDFPYSKPIVYTNPQLPCLEFPHIESDGRLCIWPNYVFIDPFELSNLEEFIRNAYRLISNNLQHSLDNDFKDGFLSYWSLNCSDNIKALSFCGLNNKHTRMISVIYPEQFGAIFHETEKSSKDWIKKRGWGKKLNIYKSLLICLDTPWLPEEYPSSLGELSEILRTQCHSEDLIAEWLMAVFRNHVDTPIILVSIETSSGVSVVSLGVEYSIHKKFPKNEASLELAAGYRKGNEPDKLILSKGSKIRIHQGKATRGDFEWMYGRDKNTLLNSISNTKVAVLGLGSVGSSVVSLLAKAGVSDFLLADGEDLEPENVSRHHLGFKSIWLKKATELKKAIINDHPHSNITIAASDWNNDKEFKSELKKADIIISCTADWPSNVYLIGLTKSRAIACPVIFGFTESYAAVSHAVVNPAFSDEALKIFTNTGELKKPVTLWKEKTMVDLPSCGDGFQPYGAIELSFGHSLIAEVALELITGTASATEFKHKIWIGSERLVASNNGNWNDEWINSNVNPNQGSFIYDAS